MSWFGEITLIYFRLVIWVCVSGAVWSPRVSCTAVETIVGVAWVVVVSSVLQGPLLLHLLLVMTPVPLEMSELFGVSQVVANLDLVLVLLYFEIFSQLLLKSSHFLVNSLFDSII
jgi:hypothetical protein